MRVGLPVAVARKVTSPVKGLEPEVGATETTGPMAASAEWASKSSKTSVPDTAAARAIPALPGPVMAESHFSSAKSGLSLQSPAAVSHCWVSVRKTTTRRRLPSAISCTPDPLRAEVLPRLEGAEVRLDPVHDANHTDRAGRA